MAAISGSFVGLDIEFSCGLEASDLWRMWVRFGKLLSSIATLTALGVVLQGSGGYEQLRKAEISGFWCSSSADTVVLCGEGLVELWILATKTFSLSAQTQRAFGYGKIA